MDLIENNGLGLMRVGLIFCVCFGLIEMGLYLMCEQILSWIVENYDLIWNLVFWINSDGFVWVYLNKVSWGWCS